MPEKSTLRRARRDKRQGKAATTQAGEFVREEMHHVREGKHGAKSKKQVVAIGLSKARRAGVKVPRRRKSAKPASKRSASSTRKRSSRSGTAHRTTKRTTKRSTARSSKRRTAHSRSGTHRRRHASH